MNAVTHATSKQLPYLAMLRNVTQAIITYTEGLYWSYQRLMCIIYSLILIISTVNFSLATCKAPRKKQISRSAPGLVSRSQTAFSSFVFGREEEKEDWLRETTPV